MEDPPLTRLHNGGTEKTPWLLAGPVTEAAPEPPPLDPEVQGWADELAEMHRYDEAQPLFARVWAHDPDAAVRAAASWSAPANLLSLFEQSGVPVVRLPPDVDPRYLVLRLAGCSSSLRAWEVEANWSDTRLEVVLRGPDQTIRGWGGGRLHPNVHPGSFCDVAALVGTLNQALQDVGDPMRWVTLPGRDDLVLCLLPYRSVARLGLKAGVPLTPCVVLGVGEEPEARLLGTMADGAPEPPATFVFEVDDLLKEDAERLYDQWVEEGAEGTHGLWKQAKEEAEYRAEALEAIEGAVGADFIVAERHLDARTLHALLAALAKDAWSFGIEFEVSIDGAQVALHQGGRTAAVGFPLAPFATGWAYSAEMRGRYLRDALAWLSRALEESYEVRWVRFPKRAAWVAAVGRAEGLARCESEGFLQRV